MQRNVIRNRDLIEFLLFPRCPSSLYEGSSAKKDKEPQVALGISLNFWIFPHLYEVFMKEIT